MGRRQGGEEDWQGDPSRHRDDQDSSEACHQGRQEDDVWAGSGGQGEARHDGGEGLPSEGLERLYLRVYFEPRSAAGLLLACLGACLRVRISWCSSCLLFGLWETCSRRSCRQHLSVHVTSTWAAWEFVLPVVTRRCCRIWSYGPRDHGQK